MYLVFGILAFAVILYWIGKNDSKDKQAKTSSLGSIIMVILTVIVVIWFLVLFFETPTRDIDHRPFLRKDW